MRLCSVRDPDPEGYVSIAGSGNFFWSDPDLFFSVVESISGQNGPYSSKPRFLDTKGMAFLKFGSIFKNFARIR
jgi:hypothetical protein